MVTHLIYIMIPCRTLVYNPIVSQTPKTVAASTNRPTLQSISENDLL